MSGEVRVCSLDELAPGQVRVVPFGAGHVAVFRLGDEYFALDDHCPHRQGPLSEGYLDGELITCPWHGWQFELRTGTCVTVPSRDVRTYPVRAAEDGVFVTLPDPA